MRCWRGIFGVVLLAELTVAGLVWAADNAAIKPVHRLPGFWDGEFTEASSGYHYGYPDPGSSEGEAGIDKKDRPEHFWIPPDRQWENVDPERLKDYEGNWFSGGEAYTPYAVVLFPRDLVYRKWALPHGYYQIKVGQANDGSPSTRLHGSESPSVYPALSGVDLRAKRRWWQKLKFWERKGPEPILVDGMAIQPNQRLVPGRNRAAWLGETLVIERLGTVKAVVPVIRTEVWKQAKEQGMAPAKPNKKHPLTGLVSLRGERAVLKVTDGKWVYISELDY